jgi:hypothetical protein
MEPHRGTTILVLGILGIVIGTAASQGAFEAIPAQ